MRNPLQIAIAMGLVVTSLLISSHPATAQKACVMTDDGDVVCGKLQQTPKKSNAESQTIEFEDVSLTLLGCKRYPNNNLKCNFSVTAKQDSTITFGDRDVKMFDLLGGEYFVSTLQIGKAISPMYRNQTSHSPSTELLKNIPLRAMVTFNEIPKQVKEIAALQLQVWSSKGNSNNNKAIFRNIPISQ
ncbi:MAG: hypothetical protein ACKPDM_24160 [Dolichospermum sp.]